VERLRNAGAFLLRAFETTPAYPHVVDDDTKIHVNEGDGIIELGCTLLGVGPMEESQLVEYLKGCVRTLNSLDSETFTKLGW
jgi:hypothetical protein